MIMEHFPLIKKLHTDVLEEKYGPIHTEVLRHDDEIREAHLSDEKGVSRTYALTFLTFDHKNKEIAEINEEIRAGGAIGKTFREHGYEVRKNVIRVYVIDLPEQLKKKFDVTEGQAKARLSEFYAEKNGEPPIIYGIVTEIYSPDFRPAEVNEADLTQDNPTTNALEKVGISKEEIWKRIGEGNDWSDKKDLIVKANELAETEEQNLQSRVDRYLAK